MHYELPDGVVVAVGVERFQVPDILMNTDPVKHLLTGKRQAQQLWPTTRTDFDASVVDLVVVR